VLTLNECTFKSSVQPGEGLRRNTNASSTPGSGGVEPRSTSIHWRAGRAVEGQARHAELQRASPFRCRSPFENWKKTTGADIVSVPSRGGSDMVTGLLTGTTPIAIVRPAELHPAYRSGAVKALAGRFGGPLAAVPDVPTLKELGFP